MSYLSGVPDITGISDRLKTVESTVKKHDQTDIPDIKTRLDKLNQSITDAQKQTQTLRDDTTNLAKNTNERIGALNSNINKVQSSVDVLKSDTNKLLSDLNTIAKNQGSINQKLSDGLKSNDTSIITINSSKWIEDKVNPVVVSIVNGWKSGGGFNKDVTAVFTPLFEGKMNGFDKNWKSGFGTCFDAQFGSKFAPAFDTQFKSSIDKVLAPINNRLKSDMDDLNNLTLVTNKLQSPKWFTDVLNSVLPGQLDSTYFPYKYGSQSGFNAFRAMFNDVAGQVTSYGMPFFKSNANPLLGFQDKFSKLSSPLELLKTQLDVMKKTSADLENQFANFNKHSMHYGGYDIGGMVYDKSPIDASGFDYMKKIGDKINSRLANRQWGDAALTAALGMAGMWNDLKDMLFKIYGMSQDLKTTCDSLKSTFDSLQKSLPAAPVALPGIFP